LIKLVIFYIIFDILYFENVFDVFPIVIEMTDDL
jgi:hypothetical protein